MDKELASTIIAHCQDKPRITYKKGEIIFRPGEQITQLAFVKEGYVRLFKILENGQEITINIFKPIFPLSLYYAITEKVNPYCFEAITDVSMWRCSVEEFDAFLAEKAELKDTIIKYLFEIFEMAIDNVVQTSVGVARNKIAALLSSIARKYGVQENGSIKIEFHTTHRIISSLCGLSRETTSRELKRLEKIGLLHQEKGRIVVDDLAALESLGN